MEKDLTHDERIQLLRDTPGETISPTLVAQVLGGDAYRYNVSAKNGRLMLPHTWRGRNLRIFKQPIIEILQGSIGGYGIPQGGNEARAHA